MGSKTPLPRASPAWGGHPCAMDPHDAAHLFWCVAAGRRGERVGNASRTAKGRQAVLAQSASLDP